MKYIFYCIIPIIVLFQSAFAQSAPQLINYQAVARSQSGAPLANTPIKVRFSIHAGGPVGTIVFQETHLLTSNQLGLFSLKIGSGTPVIGSIAAMQWGNASHFLEVEVGPQSQTGYAVSGTSELVSVPYALYVDDADADPTNEIQSLSQIGDTLFLSGGGFVVIADDVDDADADSTNELQMLSQSGDTIFLSNGGFAVIADDVDDADADPTNELQMLSQSGDTIFLSNGGFVVTLDNVIDADADPTNELQMLSQSGDTIFLSNGGFVVTIDNVIDADADPTNELQMLSQSGDTIFLSNGGFVVTIDNVNDADADPTNELQMLSQSGDTIFLTNGGFVVTIDNVIDADADSTNELQDLVANSNGEFGITQGNGMFGFVPAGAIIMWSGTTPPPGWALCDGANGTPDLRGRFIAGYDPNNSDYDNPGNFSLGGNVGADTGGASNVLLTALQSGLRAHVHPFSFSTTTDSAGLHRHPIETITGSNIGNTSRFVDTGLRTSSNRISFSEEAGAHVHTVTGSGITTPNNAEDAQQPHENRPLFWTLAYIIKLP